MIDETLNPLHLKFIDSDVIENIILREILTTYNIDEWDIQPEDVVLEIGGHTGTVALTLAKKFHCCVTTYEPYLYNYTRLVANIRENDLEYKITACNKAVTKDGRDVRMWICKGSSGCNIYGKGPTAKSISISNLLKNTWDGKLPKLIVMDCEGSEFELFENVNLYKGVKMLRGEFHAGFGDIDELLKRVKKVIPDAKPFMLYKGMKV
jgi:FkbM family methyltransferase